jgi:SAM-dependent methyltransferase
MSLLASVDHRNRQPEVMDQPGLDVAQHHEALRALGRINLLSNTASTLWPRLASLARRLGRPVRVLDVATGGGDVPIRLALRAQHSGVPLRVEGCDFNPTAVAYAQQRAREAGADVHFFTADALADPLPEGYDAVCCSLFLHHLDEEQAVNFLRRLGETAGHLVLVSDLERCWIGLLLAHLVGWVLTWSPVVRVDGPRSVEAAFTPAEARQLAERAGLHGAQIVRRWPFRYLLSWSKA